MATTAHPLTEAQFAKELSKRLGDGVSDAQTREFLKAFKEEVTDCLINGYKVTLSGLVRFEPKYVAAKPKGELVRNPATGEMQKRAAAVPASFRAKAYASSAVTKFFPSIRTKTGQELASLLGADAKPQKGK